MSDNEVMNVLSDRFADQGLKWRIVTADHLEELNEVIRGRYESGDIAEGVYREYLSDFDSSLPVELPGVCSIVIVASPQPKYEVGFTLNGRVHRFTIPPTYLHHTDDEVDEILKGVLEPSGYGFLPARLPEKLLAVRSGLAGYGRNNITYIEGWGSFFRLRAYYTDLPCFQDGWREEKVMDACAKCHLCADRCPSGALSRDRFLVRADRCITFMNETSVSWPQWVKSSWDRDSMCLVGCMKCQADCPKNRDYKDWIEPLEVFSEQETRALLEENSRARLPIRTVEKLDSLYLSEYIPVLHRNLSVLFKT
jgi:epoxyqueuosine reductase